MIEMKTSFSRRELLWFGPLFAIFAGMVGSIAIWKFDAPGLAKWIWAISGVIIVVYYLVPPLRKTMFMAWLALVFPVGWLLSHVLLTIVFYLVVFPIGLLLKLGRHDPLRRKFDLNCHSYWIKRERKKGAERYFRQF
jgi:hypothetical protein